MRPVASSGDAPQEATSVSPAGSTRISPADHPRRRSRHSTACVVASSDSAEVVPVDAGEGCRHEPNLRSFRPDRDSSRCDADRRHPTTPARRCRARRSDRCRDLGASDRLAGRDRRRPRPCGRGRAHDTRSERGRQPSTRPPIVGTVIWRAAGVPRSVHEVTVDIDDDLGGTGVENAHLPVDADLGERGDSGRRAGIVVEVRCERCGDAARVHREEPGLGCPRSP